MGDDAFDAQVAACQHDFAELVGQTAGCVLQEMSGADHRQIMREINKRLGKPIHAELPVLQY